MSNEFEFDEDDFDFDPDSVIGDDEQFAELDAFLMYLKEELEKPRVQIINPTRMKEFQYAYRVIAKIVKSVSPDAKIDFGMSELGLGSAYIRIEADEFDISDMKAFISALKLASNFEVHPLLNGNIQINIGFYDVMVGANLEEQAKGG